MDVVNDEGEEGEGRQDWMEVRFAWSRLSEGKEPGLGNGWLAVPRWHLHFAAG